MNRTSIINVMKSEQPGCNVLVKGWVRTRRDAKGFCFLEINDGSTIHNLQVVAYDSLDNYPDIEKILTGSSVAVSGTVVESPADGQKYELKAESVTIVGDCDSSYPLQKKRHSFEFLREIAHLRGRTNSFGAVFRLRNALSYAIHTFFQEQDFFYVNTPIITSSDCEGAGDMFQVTTLDLSNVPRKQNSVDYESDFFGKRTSLTVSGQLEGELLALSLGKIYTFSPTFRAENSNTSRHLSEFWMVEPEMSFATLEDNIKLAEDFVKYIFTYCLDRCEDDMAFFDKRIRPGIVKNLESIVTSQFEVITYTQAVDILLKSKQEFEYRVSWGNDLQSEHERYLTENYFKKPVFVIDYPRLIKAFYMKLNDDEKTVRAMDLLVPGIGEIIGGSEREDRYQVLLNSMNDFNINADEYNWYLDTRKYGSVPHAGFGLGFERVVQFVSGMQNIRDVIPFPRTPKNAIF